MEFTANDILTLLSAPFATSALSWRIGNKSNWDKVKRCPKDANKPVKAQMLVYIDARDVQDRLDEVCGMNWKDDYKEVQGRLVCNLQVGSTVRTDGAGDTDFEGEKGGLSDAFKRAAVKFGIGRYLYNAKNFSTWLDTAGHTDFDMPKLAKEQFADIARQLGEPVQTYQFWLNKIDACTTKQELDDVRNYALTYYKREQWSMGNLETFKKHVEDKQKQFKGE
jgi:hypothetical protein